MGAFWDLIENEVRRTHDPRFPFPSEREIAKLLKVAPGTPGNWKRGLKSLPSEKNLRSVARFVDKSYVDVLLLALAETGYARGTNLAARFGIKDVGSDG